MDIHVFFLRKILSFAFCVFDFLKVQIFNTKNFFFWKENMTGI